MFPPPAGKDGFLATNSLLAFTTLLARAYAAVFDPLVPWDEVVATIAPLTQSSGREFKLGELEQQLFGRDLRQSYSSALRQKSARLTSNSKFTEAALGVAQLADYRNFAHGRHHWLAKRGNDTAVLAFITDNDKAIANRTLDLIPEDVPVARLEIEGCGPAALLGSLLAALYHLVGRGGERDRS